MAITNSPTAKQNWLWQSEQFLIWNDGINLPVFYDGSSLRRSNGSSVAPIGNISIDLVIPKVGEVVSSNTTSQLNSFYLNQSVLVGTSQFVITKIGGDNILSSVNVTKSNIVIGAATDQLVNTPSYQTVVYKSSKYVGFINTTSGVNQNGTLISDWSSLISPSPGTGATSAQSFTMSFGSTVVYGARNIVGYPRILPGDYIRVNNVNCYVNAVTYLSGNNTQPVQTATCTPLDVGANSSLSGITFNPVAHCYCATTNTSGACTSPVDQCSSTGSYSATGSGNMVGPTNGISAAPAYFTVSLSATPDGLSNGNQYTFTAVGTNAQVITFSGIVNNAQLINCQVISKPNTPGCTVNFVTGVPTSLNQYITTTSATETSVGTIFTTVNANAISFGLSANSTVSAGQLLYATPVYNAIPLSYQDFFYVTSTSSVTGSSTNYVQLQNQTGVSGSVIPAYSSIVPIPELPVGTIGVYGLGRNWMSLPDGKSYIGGDIVGSSSGTNVNPSNYKYADAVLKVSQNQFLAGGQVNGTGLAFVVPGAGERIRAMQFTAQLDSSIGQGPLQIFTDDTVFSNTAPADATTWSKLTSPIQTEGLIGSGAISQYAVSQSNGDLFFRLSDGAIQSMMMARLDFNKWGNTPISIEVRPIIMDDQPSLLPYTSMTTFDNRLLMTCKLTQFPRGVCGTSIVALNFDPISNLSGKLPSIWEGEWNGLNILQFVTGFFNDAKQCFAICLDSLTGEIMLYRILSDSESKTATNTDAFSWSFESPMMVVDPPQGHRPYKRLISGEFSVNYLESDVSYTAYYKSDQGPDWVYWYDSVIHYDSTMNRRRISLGSPSGTVFDVANNAPTREGYNFQVKLVFSAPAMLINFKLVAEEIPEPKILAPS